MGLFNNFMGQEEHRVFNYKPIYYDKEEEERKRKFAAVDGSLEAKEGEEDGKGKAYVPGSYVHGAFRDGNYATRRGAGRVPAIIGIIGIVLFIVVLIYITKFYSML